jgi:hypothetical protein
MAHAYKDIAALDEPHEFPARPRISGIGKGHFTSAHAKPKGFEIGLSMGDGYNFYLPISPEDYHAVFENLYLRCRPLSRTSASTREVGLHTRFMLGPCGQIRVKDPAFLEKKIHHLPDVVQPIDLELRNPACPLILPRQHEAGVVEAMIEVKMREKEMRNPRDLDPCFQQAMESARTMVEDKHVITGFHQTPGTHFFQRRVRDPRPQESNPHGVFLPKVCHGSMISAESSVLFHTLTLTLTASSPRSSSDESHFALACF